MSSLIRVQEKDFDISAEVAALRKGDPRVGAVVTLQHLVKMLNYMILICMMMIIIIM